MIKKIKKLFRKPKKFGSGGYQCFHCLENTVCWESDFDYEDWGLEGEGIVHVCHCSNCGAEINYYIPLGDQNDSES